MTLNLFKGSVFFISVSSKTGRKYMSIAVSIQLGTNRKPYVRPILISTTIAETTVQITEAAAERTWDSTRQ